MKKPRLNREMIRVLNPSELGRAKGAVEPTPPYYYSQIQVLCLVSKVESCANCLTPD